MRPLTILLFAVALPAHAQLINGSFEDANGFSLAGWEWTCAAPVGGTDVPVSAGQWCAGLEAGNLVCSPSYLFQRIPFAVSGTHYILAGWVKTDDAGWGVLPRIGFGSLNNGIITTQSWVGNPAPDWYYCWINDTAHATATDTTVAVLTAGEAFMGQGWFDGIELDPADPTALDERTHRMQFLLDEQGLLHVAVPGREPRSVQLFDATGREVFVEPRIVNGTVLFSTTHLATGVHVLRLLTDDGPMTGRFFKP